MSRIPLINHINIKFYTQYTHPTLICRGMDARTYAQTNAHMDNIYSIFRDKLLLLGEHVYPLFVNEFFMKRIYSFMKTVMKGALQIEHYSGRVESAPGRGAIHLHRRFCACHDKEKGITQLAQDCMIHHCNRYYLKSNKAGTPRTCRSHYGTDSEFG